jgi:hypothetical protein
MFIQLTTASNAGGKCRLGIYSNAGPANNAPGARLFTGGDFAVDSAVGIKSTGTLTQALAADTRYWAAIQTNASVTNGQVASLGGSSTPVIYWGTVISGNALVSPSCVPVAVANFGNPGDPLPDPFPASPTAFTGSVAAIGLAFSNV